MGPVPVRMVGFEPAGCFVWAATMKAGLIWRRVVRVVDLVLDEAMHGLAEGAEERRGLPGNVDSIHDSIPSAAVTDVARRTAVLPSVVAAEADLPAILETSLPGVTLGIHQQRRLVLYIDINVETASYALEVAHNVATC